MPSPITPVIFFKFVSVTMGSTVYLVADKWVELRIVIKIDISVIKIDITRNTSN